MKYYISDMQYILYIYMFVAVAKTTVVTTITITTITTTIATSTASTGTINSVLCKALRGYEFNDYRDVYIVPYFIIYLSPSKANDPIII